MPSIKMGETPFGVYVEEKNQEFRFGDVEFEMSKSWIYEPGVEKRSLG